MSNYYFGLIRLSNSYIALKNLNNFNVYYVYSGDNRWRQIVSNSYTVVDAAAVLRATQSYETPIPLFPNCSSGALSKENITSISFLSENGFKTIYNTELIGYDYDNPYPITVVDSISTGLSSITINDGGHLGNVVYNNQTYSSFPATITLDPAKTTMTAIGTTYDVRLTNVHNMKQIKIGSTVVSTFPYTLSVNEDKTVEMSGEDDKTITVNYTNTTTPVVTDT